MWFFDIVIDKKWTGGTGGTGSREDPPAYVFKKKWGETFATSFTAVQDGVLFFIFSTN